MSDLRTIDVGRITDEIARLCSEAAFELPEDVRQAIQKASKNEASPVGKEVLQRLIDNADVASAEKLPICQDCGLAIVYLDIGQDVHLTGGDVTEAANEGVRRGYRDVYLRKSVCHPFTRANTGDNTPAVVNTRIVPGDKVHIYLMPKGGGSENMSRVYLLTPAQGRQGVVDMVRETVMNAGPNPCPPIIVGVAIGGTFDQAAKNAKRTFLRQLGSVNPDPEAAELEAELMDEINAIGIGPAGLGGSQTALGVFVDIQPCHIASLPVAVNIQCHAARHKEAVL